MDVQSLQDSLVYVAKAKVGRYAIQSPQVRNLWVLVPQKDIIYVLWKMIEITKE